jgi:molybdate transport system substrate-binding protein
MRRASIVLLLAGLACALLIGQARADQTIQVAAAANLIDVFNKQIIPAFTKKTGITVLPTYAATGLLAKQLENGAPYDVFVSADVATADRLAKENLLDPNSVKVYAVGQLALWSKSLPVSRDGLSVLTTPQVTNIAVANPKTAPYGAAAIETLTNLGDLAQVQSKIVYSENIGQALQFAQSGNADVAFTAYSLVIGSTAGSFLVVPAKLHAPIAQALGVSPTASSAARRFEAFLLSDEGAKLFAAAGYLSAPK